MTEKTYKTDYRPLFWLKEACRGLDYIEHRRYPDWRGYLPFYRIHCPIHGETEAYPRGYMKLLRCSRCEAEHFGKFKSIEAKE